MALHRRDLPRPLIDILRRGAVIPAHPLALDEKRKLDTRRQRALSRYYLDAGAGGLSHESCAHKQRHGFKVNFAADLVSSLQALPRPEIEPGSPGEIERARSGALLHHWRR